MGSKRPTKQPNESPPSMYSIREALEQLAQEQFAVLVTTRGFTALPPERSVITTTFYFTHRTLGLQITLDFRDETVYVYLLRLRDGRVPKHGYIVDGEVVRLPLRFVLRDVLQAADEQMDALDAFVRARSPLDYEAAVEAVKRWGEIVVQSVNHLEQTSSATLFPPADAISQRTNIG